MKRWLVIDPLTKLPLGLYESHKQASQASVQATNECNDHPAYLLYWLDADSLEVEYMGSLWRRMGEDFDWRDCWRR